MESQSQNSYGAEAFISASLPSTISLALFTRIDHTVLTVTSTVLSIRNLLIAKAQIKVEHLKSPMQYNDTQFDLAKLFGSLLLN